MMKDDAHSGSKSIIDTICKPYVLRLGAYDVCVSLDMMIAGIGMGHPPTRRQEEAINDQGSRNAADCKVSTVVAR